MEQELSAWSSQMAAFHIPRWCELPDMDLYMDQVIGQLDKYLAPMQSCSDEHFVTASMINNYVKQQLLPAPVKKRYSRVHMAHLVVICLLKQVLSIPEVKMLLCTCLTSRPESELPVGYDMFCAAQECSFGRVAKMAAQQESAVHSRADLAVDAAALACAGKALAQKLIPAAQEQP
ncbi:MAG: DUF1836 domain-containing protein [Ruthenibacterium sp.]